jgi:signal transduction histidine kinase
VAIEALASGIYGLLKANRDRLVARWGDGIKAIVATRPLSQAELLDNVPGFVDEVIAALHPQALPLPSASPNAPEHGAQRLRLGFDVAEVVREFGLLHDCVLDVAGEAGVALTTRDQHVLNKWLNAGIAFSVEEYVNQRDRELERQASQHLGFIAHELRNLLSAAMTALQRMQLTGAAGDGRAAEVLERNLRRTAEMIDDTLSQASFKMGVEPRSEPTPVLPFLEAIAADWDVEARARQIRLSLSASPDLSIAADRRLLRSAVSNLLHNALKFSRQGSQVTVGARQAGDRVLIEVADSCGGLPAGKVEELFAPSVQRGLDRTGFGFGLAIARQAAEAHTGSIRVRDVPGTGCVFSVDLPAVRSA